MFTINVLRYKYPKRLECSQVLIPDAYVGKASQSDMFSELLDKPVHYLPITNTLVLRQHFTNNFIETSSSDD
jgi:hypothetical protein